MMRRFNYDDNDDYQYEVDSFFSDELDFDEEESMMIETELMELANAVFVSYEINQKLLKLSIQTAKKSFFWKFRSLDKKLEIIAKIYFSLKVLIEE